MLGEQSLSERAFTVTFFLGAVLEKVVVALDVMAAPAGSVDGDFSDITGGLPGLLLGSAIVYSAIMFAYLAYGRSRIWIRVLARVALLFSVLVTAGYLVVEGAYDTLASAVLGLGSALLTYGVLRALLRMATRLTTPRARIKYLAGCVLLGSSLLTVWLGFSKAWSFSSAPGPGFVADTIAASAPYNTLNLVIIFGMLVTAGGLLFYRFGWPLLSRFLYQIPGQAVISSRRNLWLAAGSLMASALTAPWLFGASSNACRFPAYLYGTVDPSSGTWTGIWFEWGTTPALGYTTPPQVLGRLASPQEFRHEISVTGGTKYFYRAVVESRRGRKAGKILDFTVEECNDRTED